MYDFTTNFICFVTRDAGAGDLAASGGMRVRGGGDGAPAYPFLAPT